MVGTSPAMTDMEHFLSQPCAASLALLTAGPSLVQNPERFAASSRSRAAGPAPTG